MLFLARQPLAGTGLDRLATYLYIRYQALQLLGYHLVGTRCRYQWGAYGVQPVGHLTPRQQIVGTAFPTLILTAIKLSPPDPPLGGEKTKIPPVGGVGGPEPATNLMAVTLILGLLLLIQLAGSLYLALAYVPHAPWLLVPLLLQPAFPVSLFVSFIILDMLRLRRSLKHVSQPA